MKIYLSLMVAFFACQQNDSEIKPSDIKSNDQVNSKISDYWYQGKAEVTSYILEQNRYKEVHGGHVVLIQVTEDFLTDKQVKNDSYTNSNSVPIFKSNLISKFTTGLYDYSIMTSTFTNADGNSSFKVSNSSQDWCGQSWRQLNKKGKSYKLSTNSYFESEADQVQNVDKVRLEDEVFNQIRILKTDLPEGKMDILPSLSLLSLLHLDPIPIESICSFENTFGGEAIAENHRVYYIHMPSINRKLEILIDTDNEYSIEAWNDSYPSVFDKSIRTTRATKNKRLLVDYWNKNRVNDVEFRNKLGLK